MNRTRVFPTILLLASSCLPLLAACASGPGPDLAGPRGPSLMAAYSGDWVLLRLESDDLAAKVRQAQGRGVPSGGGFGGGMPGGRPGGGMTGGRPGGGMTGGRPGGGGMPGGRDPQDLRQALVTLQVLSATPETVSLTLSPGRVVLTYPDSSVLDLVLGADEIEVRRDAAYYFAAADWTKKGVELKRESDQGAGVQDRISVDEQGRLVMKRTIELPMGGSVEGTLVYRRKP